MPNPGYDILIADDALGGDVAASTDRLFLLVANATGFAAPTVKVRADTGIAAVDDRLRSYYASGGLSVYVQGWQATPTTLPSLSAAMDLLPPGPGQVVAPEAVTTADHFAITAKAWAQGKVALLNGPSGATDAALTTLATADIAAGDMRGASLFGDWETWPAASGGGTVNVPMSVSVAGMIARNDRILRNPNVAAAGVNGRSTSIGLVAPGPRGDASVSTLKGSQVNAAKVIPGTAEVRNYGFRTLANLNTAPQWWDFSGTRTVMAFRAGAASIDEDLVFGQIDGVRTLQDRYEGALRQKLKDLYDRGALFGATPQDAYHVDTGSGVNTLADLQAGKVSALVRMKVSPFAEYVVTTIARRALASGLTA